MPTTRKPKVMEAPKEAPEEDPGAGSVASTETEPVAPPPPSVPMRKHPVGEDGRRLLRDAMAELGQDRDLGNRVADWFDKHPNAQVSVTGRTPEPPLRVFSTPDRDPVVPETVPFRSPEES